MQHNAKKEESKDSKKQDSEPEKSNVLQIEDAKRPEPASKESPAQSAENQSEKKKENATPSPPAEAKKNETGQQKKAEPRVHLLTEDEKDEALRIILEAENGKVDDKTMEHRYKMKATKYHPDSLLPKLKDYTTDEKDIVDENFKTYGKLKDEAKNDYAYWKGLKGNENKTTEDFIKFERQKRKHIKKQDELRQEKYRQNTANQETKDQQKEQAEPSAKSEQSKSSPNPEKERKAEREPESRQEQASEREEKRSRKRSYSTSEKGPEEKKTTSEQEKSQSGTSPSHSQEYGQRATSQSMQPRYDTSSRSRNIDPTIALLVLLTIMLLEQQRMHRREKSTDVMDLIKTLLLLQMIKNVMVHGFKPEMKNPAQREEQKENGSLEITAPRNK